MDLFDERESKDCDERASVGRRRGNRKRQGNSVEERVARAEMLVHMGELSAARQAHEWQTTHLST